MSRIILKDWTTTQNRHPLTGSCSTSYRGVEHMESLCSFQVEVPTHVAFSCFSYVKTSRLCALSWCYHTAALAFQHQAERRAVTTGFACFCISTIARGEDGTWRRLAHLLCFFNFSDVLSKEFLGFELNHWMMSILGTTLQWENWWQGPGDNELMISSILFVSTAEEILTYTYLKNLYGQGRGKVIRVPQFCHELFLLKEDKPWEIMIKTDI